MGVLLPKFPLKRFPAMARLALLGAVIAGPYGALHDQISYMLSPEYFTKFKFLQFSWADMGWPDQLYASEVGFLATWWVGLFGGWFLARAGLAEMPDSIRSKSIVKAFAIVFAVAPATGLLGALIGIARTRYADLSIWSEIQQGLDLQDLRAFIIVSYLHTAGYVGALLGLILAIIYVRRTRPGLKPFSCKPACAEAASPQPFFPPTMQGKR